MQSRLTYKEYGAIKIYNKENDKWTYIRPINIGDIKQSVSQKDHNGWMICDGRSLNRVDYPLLYSLIGTSFGTESGTTFNLPDARGRVPGSIGQGSGLINRTMGSYIGSETHTMTINEMPSHTHGSNSVGGSLGLMTANGSSTAINGDNSPTEPNIFAAPVALSISAAGSGQAFDIMQPTVFIANTFIYAFST